MQNRFKFAWRKSLSSLFMVDFLRTQKKISCSVLVVEMSILCLILNCFCFGSRDCWSWTHKLYLYGVLYVYTLVNAWLVTMSITNLLFLIIYVTHTFFFTLFHLKVKVRIMYVFNFSSAVVLHFFYQECFLRSFFHCSPSECLIFPSKQQKIKMLEMLEWLFWSQPVFYTNVCACRLLEICIHPAYQACYVSSCFEIEAQVKEKLESRTLLTQ